MEKVIFETEQDIRFHICALKHLAFADGEFCEKEKAYINTVIQNYSLLIPGLETSSLLEMEFSPSQYDEALECIKTSPEKSRHLLCELIMLGHVDGDYSPDEKNVVYETGKKLGIPQETISDLEQKVEHMLSAMQQLNDAIAGA